MELKFLGRGAAFNPKEGNNSAYFIDNNKLFLIDCGESVFKSIIENNLLNNIEIINIMITHTHSDHIGSLGSLVMYSHYILHKPLNIIMKANAKHIPNINKILDGFGCLEEMYNYINEEDLDNKHSEFDSVRYIETRHCDELDSYGLLFNTKEGYVYYSGDTNELGPVKALIESDNPIDKLYIDTTSANYPGNIHLNIDILNSEIPNDLKEKVYCMHLNDNKCFEKALEYGFNIVEKERSKTIIKQ